MSLLTNGTLPLSVVIEELIFVLQAVSPKYDYKDGTKTDNLIGYTYTAANTDTYDIVKVSVEQAQPAITSEDLRKAKLAGKKVFVEFDNALIRPYYSEFHKSVQDSIKADDVIIVEPSK